MKKKGIENINIEKNKELFEYEMTEVILKLKGEFVTFSGKGTKYEDNKVAEETLKLELYPLENVSLETYKGEVPDVKKIPPIVLSDIRVEMEKIDDLTSQVEAIGEMHLSSVSKFKKASKEIVVKSIPKLPFICDTFLVKQEYINLPNILGNVQRNALIPNIKMAFIKVKMPTTTIKVSKSGYANAKRIAINVPRTDIKCLYNRAEIKTEKYYIKTVVPSVKLKGIKKVYDISRPNIKGVSIPEFKHVRINPVDPDDVQFCVKDKGKSREIEVKAIPKLYFACNPFVVEGKNKICIDIPQTDCQFWEMQLKAGINGASKEIVVKSIPKLPFICDTFLVKQEYINLPNILGNVQRNALIPNIKMAFIKVKMPTTTIKVSKSGYANAKRIAINVPRTDIKCLYNRAEIKTEKYYIKTVVPSVKLKGIKKVYDISRPNIKGVSIPEFKHVRINPVDTKNIRIIIPNTDIESYRERKVKIEKKNIISEVPNIPVVNECVIDYCELTQKKMEEITIPHFGTEDFKISKIEMNPMQRIEIPLKLDVSDDIDRIVSLAIS